MLPPPLHAKLMPSPITVRAATRLSRVPERMLSPVFRRVTRPRRRVGDGVKQRTPLLVRVNSGELAFVPPPKPPDGLVSIDQIANKIATPSDRNLASRWGWYLLGLILLVAVLALVAAVTVGFVAAAVVVGAGVAAGVALYNRAQIAMRKSAASDELHVSNFTPQVVT